MRNSPSVKALQEVRTVHEAPLHLVDESREVFDSFFHKCCNSDDINMSTINFEDMSERYNEMPTLNNLFGMAFFAMPISKDTAVMYCKILLEKYPFHKGAQGIIEKFEPID